MGPASLTALVQQAKAAGISTVAVASVSSEAVCALARELQALARSAHSVNVAAVSAGETRILLRKCA